MSNTAANFFNRVGLLIPGFKGYKTKEELRDSDYKIRLFTQNTVEIFIQKIEKYKRELDSDELLEVDFQQKDLTVQETDYFPHSLFSSYKPIILIFSFIDLF